MDLNSTDMFSGYDQLVKHNPEVNWNTRTIWFTRYPRNYRTQHQDIVFRNRQIQPMGNQDKEHQEIKKELDLTNSENILDYIQPFIHLFNKKKFKKLLERKE